MVLSIISAVFSSFPIILAGIGLGVTKERGYYGSRNPDQRHSE